MPNETVDQERYLYKVALLPLRCILLKIPISKFSPAIPESSANYVHHIVAYLCTNLNHSHVGASERCSGSHIDIEICRFTGVLFAAWAVGGTVNTLHAHAAD